MQFDSDNWIAGEFADFQAPPPLSRGFEQCVHWTVIFSCSQNSPVDATFYSPVGATEPLSGE